MVKFHYRNVCVYSPASRNLRKIADQARQHGCAACSHHNITQQLPKHVIINAPRSSLYPFPNATLSSPHLQRSAKRKTTCNENMQMKRPPQKLGPISTPRVECQCAVPFCNSVSAPCRCSRLNATSTSNHPSPITP
jgi:hypothetical protein